MESQKIQNSRIILPSMVISPSDGTFWGKRVGRYSDRALAAKGYPWNGQPYPQGTPGDFSKSTEAVRLEKKAG